MRKIWNWLFGSKERTYYTVALQGKYTDVGVNVETYVSSHIFETVDEACRFAMRLEEDTRSYKILGLVELRTNVPVTVTHIDYDVTDEYGRHQISYTWPEGVDTSAQTEAEQAKEDATKTEVRPESERKPAQKRRPRRKNA